VLAYRSHAARYILPFLGDGKVADVSAADVRAFRQYVRTVSPNASQATQQRVFATLRVFLRDCWADNLIAIDPTLAQRSRRQKSNTGISSPKVRPWEPEQLRRVIEWVYEQGERLAPVVAFASLSGLRRGELAGLRWVDVDVARRRLIVAQQYIQVGADLIVGAPKTASGEQRTVDLTLVAVDVHTRVQTRQEAERAEWRDAYQEFGLVFAREDGRPIAPEMLTKGFTRLVKRFNAAQETPLTRVPVIRLHDLRHAQASLMLAADVDTSIVSKRLGHAGIAITSDTYQHLIGTAGARAAQAAADVLGFNFPTVR